MRLSRPVATPPPDPDPRAFELGTQVKLARRLVWLAAGLMAVFVPVDLFVTGYLAHAAAEAAGAVTLLITAWLLGDRRRLGLAQTLGTGAVAAVILVVVYTGRGADAVLVWVALFPPITFFLFGLRRGLWSASAFAAVVLAALAGGLVIAQRGAVGAAAPWLAPWLDRIPPAWGGLGDYGPIALLNVAGALATAIALAWLYEQARAEAARRLIEAANTDQLTGVPNRRGFLAGFEPRYRRCRRERRPLALLVFDLDRLKQINDQHGHAAGDGAIRHIAAVVAGRVREQDLLGRLGGDEFALLLPDTDLIGALALAESIRAGLRASPLHWHGQPIDLTLSLGATELTPATVTDAIAAEQVFETLFARADDQLYAAKRQGRDRERGVDRHGAPLTRPPRG